MERANHNHDDHERRQPPDERLIRAEVIERLTDSPEEATPRGIEVATAMINACVRAHTAGDVLPELEARALAHILSFAIDDGDALQRFANDQVVEMSDVRAEYTQLASRPSVYPETRAVIDWLGNYVLDASYPEFEPPANDQSSDWQHHIAFNGDLGLTLAFHLPGDEQDPREDAAFMERLERFALDHGTAGLAFLRLPTTDASRDALDARFTRSYVNSYESVDVLMAAHFRIFRLEDDDVTTTPVALSELSAERMQDLYARAGDNLVLVEVAGQIHAFRRSAIDPKPDDSPEQEHPHEREP